MIEKVKATRRHVWLSGLGELTSLLWWHCKWRGLRLGPHPLNRKFGVIIVGGFNWSKQIETTQVKTTAGMQERSRVVYAGYRFQIRVRNPFIKAEK